MTPQTLAPDVHQQIEALAARGDMLAAEARYEEAIEVYDRALSLVPEPKNDWEASRKSIDSAGSLRPKSQ